MAPQGKDRVAFYCITWQEEGLEKSGRKLAEMSMCLTKQHVHVSMRETARDGRRTLAFRRSLPNMSFSSGTGAFSPSTLSHSRRQLPAQQR